MRTMFVALVFVAGLATFSAHRAEAYTVAECRQAWRQAVLGCREACDQAELRDGVSRGQCKTTCRRARTQFMKLCRRFGQLPR